MKTSFSSLKLVAVVCFFVFCFSACVENKSVGLLRDDFKRDLRELRSVQAEHTATLSEVRSQMRQLNGQIEELQFKSQGRARELESTIQKLGSRVPPPPGVPQDLLEADQQRIESSQGEAANLFKNALGQLRAGEFETARDGFSSFAKSNPGTSFTDNALFWAGISSLKLGQNDKAILLFSEVFQTYPAEDMTPASLFYLAEVFQKSGSRDDAILTLEKLVDEHPSSRFAVRAKPRIRSLQSSR